MYEEGRLTEGSRHSGKGLVYWKMELRRHPEWKLGIKSWKPERGDGP